MRKMHFSGVPVSCCSCHSLQASRNRRLAKNEFVRFSFIILAISVRDGLKMSCRLSALASIKWALSPICTVSDFQLCSLCGLARKASSSEVDSKFCFTSGRLKPLRRLAIHQMLPGLSGWRAEPAQQRPHLQPQNMPRSRLFFTVPTRYEKGTISFCAKGPHHR